MPSQPLPQRALRGHRPQRATFREAGGIEHQARLAERLQPRDRWLVAMLHEHKVLTSHQVTALAWPSARAANYRLRELYRWRVVDRFQPFLGRGSAPMHYVLGAAGATLLAHEGGIEPRQLGYRPEREIGRAHSPRLAHTVGVNGVMAALVAASRRPQAAGTLTAWWSEARCARLFGDTVRPDAYGRWRQDCREIEWFLEFDCGTEALSVLTAKLIDYHRLAESSGIRTPVLFWFSSARREASARLALDTASRALAQPDLVPLATASGDAVADADAGWLPINSQKTRLRLADLAARWPCPALSGEHPCTSGPADVLPPPVPLPPDSPRYSLGP